MHKLENIKPGYIVEVKCQVPFSSEGCGRIINFKHALTYTSISFSECPVTFTLE